MTGFRRALLPLALLLAMAIAAPRAWHFVSTIPEADFADARPFGFDRVSIPALPFDTTGFRTETRLIRWGSDRGHRHGTYELIDAEGRVRLRGAFERGSRIGEWQGFDAEGVLVLSGHYLDDVRDGSWLEPLGSRAAEVEYSRGVLLRWRMTIGTHRTRWGSAPPGFDGELALHAIGRGSAIPGSFVAIGLGHFHKSANSVDPDWVEEGTWVCIDVGGFGPMRLGRPVGLWTFFSASGGIDRQVRFGLEGSQEEERTAPPWHDVAESFHPAGADS